MPWNRLYLIGTTDSRFDGDLDEVVATDDEIRYLVAETNKLFGRRPRRRRRAYAGVRPLPSAPDGDEAALITRGA